MKNIGFTLIELLAVILILGIIALIAVPVVNDVLTESKMGAFKSTAMNLASKAEETCQLEGIKGKELTSLYTIVEGKLDKPLNIKGSIPDEGYILLNSNCEVAYSFYNSKNVVSKNFKEDKPTVNNKDTAPVYGLKWQSNTVEGDDYLNDTYTRTHDASNIDDNSVKAQIGEIPVTNAFDELDIYKDIIPYTDEFGNKFMLIPKFYISKTKEVTDTEVVWNYAISKNKLDNTYYLPACFVDEGEDNNQYIELPYVLVGKYEAGSEVINDQERLISKSGIMPKVDVTLLETKDLVDYYSDNGLNGYQLYDIHVHDILSVLFSIEFKTMHFDKIMAGNTKNQTLGLPTGKSDFISSSSGTLLNDQKNSFNYRGIENLWGNIWQYTDGVYIDNNINDTTVIEEMISNIYISKNSRNYKIDDENSTYQLVKEYKKMNVTGYVKNVGFDPEFPFVNFPVETNGQIDKGMSLYYYQSLLHGYNILSVGGCWSANNTGLNYFHLGLNSKTNGDNFGSRIMKLPLT